MIRLSPLLKISSRSLQTSSIFSSALPLNNSQLAPFYTANLVSNSRYAFVSDPRGNRPGSEDKNALGTDKKVFDPEGNEFKDPMKTEEENEKEDEASFQNENKRSIYFFLVASMGLIGGYAIMQMNAMREEKKSIKSQKITYTGKADIGGPWKLLDMQGNVVTDKDMKGSYYLIYFGFCNCPDICPISLQKLSKALEHIRRMPESKYLKLKTLFVSVDPDRDTPERMAKFLSHFDKSIIALKGRSNDDPELRATMNKFRIYATKIELDEAPKKPGDKKPYTLDHTIITYLMDDNNEFVTHLGSSLSDRDLAQIIVDSVLTREREKSRGMSN